MQDVSFDIASPVRNTLMNFDDSLFWRTPNSEGLAATSTSRPSSTDTDGSTGLKTSCSTTPSNVADAVAGTISGVTPSEDKSIQDLVAAYYPSQLSVFDLLTNSLDDLKAQLNKYFNC